MGGKIYFSEYKVGEVAVYLKEDSNEMESGYYGKKQAISSSDLAKAANIPLYLSYAVEIGGFTRRKQKIDYISQPFHESCGQG